MSDKENEELAKLEFLVIKSRNLLQEQFSSYDSITNKAGILISISALLTPIAITFISNSETSIYIKYSTIIPIISMGFALTFLMKVLINKELKKGFDFEQFDSQFKQSHKELLAYEIGANKSSFYSNIVTTKRHNDKFDVGIRLIYFSAIFIFCLIALSMFLSNKISEENKKDTVIIEQLNINKTY